MTQPLVSSADAKALSDRIRDVKDQADMVEGRTEVLHEHITEVRDKYAHIDAVQIRQSDVNVALGAQARHLAEIDTHLIQVIRTQQEHSGRLQLLDEILAVQREHSDRLKQLDDVLAVQREHSDRLDRMDGRFDQVDQRFDRMDGRLDQMDSRFDRMDSRFDQMDGRLDQMDSRFDRMDQRFDKMEGKLDLVLEHLGLAQSGSQN